MQFLIKHIKPIKSSSSILNASRSELGPSPGKAQFTSRSSGGCHDFDFSLLGASIIADFIQKDNDDVSLYEQKLKNMNKLIKINSGNN